MALQRLGPQLTGRISVNTLVSGEQKELRGSVEERSVVELALRLHLEKRLAGLRMRQLCEGSRELNNKRLVGPDSVREVDLPPIADGIRSRRLEVDLGARRIPLLLSSCPARGRDAVEVEVTSIL